MRTINIMEVCGTHTMSIAKSGIKSILPENINLISGPGCPVCVTPSAVIDAFLELSKRDGVVIATYGDMLRVPGSKRGESLLTGQACGAKARIVYSPMDAIDMALDNPEKEVVFLGVGFETTAPGTALAIKAAAKRGVKNFSVLCMLKKIEPALRALLSYDASGPFPKDNAGSCQARAVNALQIDGLLCPGHVAVILGEEGFSFLPNEFHMPSVIAGFEPAEIMQAIRMLLAQINAGEARLENAYKDVVRSRGNAAAKKIVAEVFDAAAGFNDDWRGLGYINGSGFSISDEYRDFDAAKKFGIEVGASKEDPACRCGDVICGRLAPEACPLFGKACTPSDPVGPCMVSGEGSCAAAYIYGGSH